MTTPWLPRKVQDFSEQLQGLVNKAELIITRTTPGKAGEPTQEALDFLSQQIITPAKDELAKGPVSEDTYQEYVNKYKEYLAMPVTSLLNDYSEDYYYQIRNAQLTDYYAAVNSSNQIVRSGNSLNDENLWFIKKNNDGSIKIFNKKTQKQA